MRTSESAELQINETRHQRATEFLSKAEALKERILASTSTEDSVNVGALFNEARENFLLAINQLTRISIKNDDYYRVKAKYHFSHAQLYFLLNPHYALINDKCYLAEVGVELSQDKFGGNNYDPSACYELVTTVADGLMDANTNNAEKWIHINLKVKERYHVVVYPRMLER